jgi:4a-hydroxytetrahydrobiopterin dehydratase
MVESSKTAPSVKELAPTPLSGYSLVMPKLTETELLKAFEDGLPGWEGDLKAIHKRFTTKNFAEGMKFLNAVADVAAKMDHHPDVLLTFNRVIITVRTHDEGGVTEKDIALANAIDAVAPGKG